MEWGCSGDLLTDSNKDANNTVVFPLAYNSFSRIVITSAEGRYNSNDKEPGIVGLTLTDFGISYGSSSGTSAVSWYWISIGY